VITDEAGRYIAVPCKTLVKGQTMWLLSIYAPVNEQEKRVFYEKKLKVLSNKMLEASSSNDIIVIGMDANATRNPIMDVEWEMYQPETRNERMKQLRKASVVVNDWADNMDLQDTWHRLFPEQRVYTRELMGQKVQDEGGGRLKVRNIAKRLDYMLINRAFSQIHTHSWVCRPAEMDWASDHAMLGITIMDMPLIRAEMRNAYQRSIFKLDGLVGRKDDLQKELIELFEQAKHKKDGLAWVAGSECEYVEMPAANAGKCSRMGGKGEPGMDGIEVP